MTGLNEKQMSPQFTSRTGVKVRWLHVAARWHPQRLGIIHSGDTGRLSGLFQRQILAILKHPRRILMPRSTQGGKSLGFPRQGQQTVMGGSLGHGSQGPSHAIRRRGRCTAGPSKQQKFCCVKAKPSPSIPFSAPRGKIDQYSGKSKLQWRHLFPSPLNLSLKKLDKDPPSSKQSPFKILSLGHPLRGWTKKRITVPLKRFSCSGEDIDLRNQSKSLPFEEWHRKNL